MHIKTYNEGVEEWFFKEPTEREQEIMRVEEIRNKKSNNE